MKCFCEYFNREKVLAPAWRARGTLPLCRVRLLKHSKQSSSVQNKDEYNVYRPIITVVINDSNEQSVFALILTVGKAAAICAALRQRLDLRILFYFILFYFIPFYSIFCHIYLQELSGTHCTHSNWYK